MTRLQGSAQIAPLRWPESLAACFHPGKRTSTEGAALVLKQTIIHPFIQCKSCFLKPQGGCEGELAHQSIRLMSDNHSLKMSPFPRPAFLPQCSMITPFSFPFFFF